MIIGYLNKGEYCFNLKRILFGIKRQEKNGICCYFKNGYVYNNYFVYGVDYQIKINLGVLMIINKCDKFIILGDFYVI